MSFLLAQLSPARMTPTAGQIILAGGLVFILISVVIWWLTKPKG
jgi:hypothetical protein